MAPDGYMLDTTEFNALVNGDVALSTYAHLRVFATHVQLDELKNTPNGQRRSHLIFAFEEISPEPTNRNGFVGYQQMG
jgi:hypothetical protein